MAFSFSRFKFFTTLALAFVAVDGFANNETEFFGLTEQSIPVSKLSQAEVALAYKRGVFRIPSGFLRPIHQHESSEARCLFSKEFLNWKSVHDESFRVRLRKLVNIHYSLDPRGFHLGELFSEIRRGGFGYIHRSQLSAVPADLKVIPIVK